MADKKITDLELAAAFLGTHSLPVDNSVVTQRATGQQIFDFIVDEGGFVLGTYDAGTTYADADLVLYLGRVWCSLAGSNVGNTPSIASTSWTPVTLGPNGTITNDQDQYFTSLATDFSSPQSITLTPGTGKTNIVSVMWHGFYLEQNGTSATPEITIAIKDGGTTLATKAFNRTFDASRTADVVWQAIFRVAKPATDYTVTFTDTQSGGGAHSWRFVNATASVVDFDGS